MDQDMISISRGDPLTTTADVLIHPTTGAEAPAGERFPDFYQQAGDVLLQSLQQDQPLRMGEATTTDGGSLPFQSIVHVPVRTGPDVPTTPDNLQVAYRTALVRADESPHRTLVLPAPVPANDLGDQLGDVANTLWNDFLQYPPVSLKTIQVIDPDTDWIEAFQKLKG